MQVKKLLGVVPGMRENTIYLKSEDTFKLKAQMDNGVTAEIGLFRPVVEGHLMVDSNGQAWIRIKNMTAREKTT